MSLFFLNRNFLLAYRIFPFRNETCATWSNMKMSSYEKAKKYLKNRKNVLGNLVKSQGYKTCHHIDSLDASKCAEDCKAMEKGKFAKNCKENGGLFKCCIRRDKMNCHECRFCCTLPMCTYSPGYKDNTIFDMEHKIKSKKGMNKVTADEIFFSDQHVYRSHNYYCLKPYSHEYPEKWHRYEVAGYRQAFNKEMLNNTRTFIYDKYLYNFVDPKIFNAFTKNDRKASKIWKKSYEWHYMKRVPGDESSSYVSSNESWTNITRCVEKCIKMEQSKFAKKCEKDGGFFKCCVTRWRMHEFEEIRNRLIQDGLINDNITNICDKKSTKDRCLFCRANGICTKQRPLDGTKTHFFYPKMKKKTQSKFTDPLVKKFHKYF